ncbi:transcriptional regulator, TetR family [Actinacidiphila paucisporea]|uniref:Transcriptional regulator, TetR family n=2 Tax=Actinacidiphila paucisporea TaxID=310782 RepID=A0A1M7QVX9_9ACTN|nr:TetR/AcrR family transcriptional regulator [Actinacidiphila paucisporea]SHN35983.1 transcriptional regulator, TetR family [Actinacidiphila paucisporea]
MSPRPYEMGRRQSSVDETRGRIVAAARDLLVEKGIVAVDAVARRADVSRATVYYQFGTKIGLLEALCDDLAARGHMQQLAEAFGLIDAHAALRAFVHTIADFWAVDRACTRRLRGLAALDPDVGQVIGARDERRRAGAEVLARRLATADGDPASEGSQMNGRFAAVLYTLTGFEVFDSLAGDGPLAEAAPTVLALLHAALGDPPPGADA